MRQVLQHLRTGQMELTSAPSPQGGRGQVLVQTTASLISAGTERMLVEFSKGNLLQKARSQPDKVKQVLDKMKTDGLLPTLEAVFSKLDEPLPLGYCNAGVILDCPGGEAHGFAPGDRVASNGPHAEIVSVPHNLCAKVPDGVLDEEATFTVLASIALQGIRLANPTLGERFVVFGLGLIGLLTVQLLRANGCEVLGVDFNPERLKLAEGFGAATVNLSAGADPVTAALAWTGGVGADGVIITASAKTDEIMHQAAEASRKRGRIVLVGVVGLNLRRDDFYKKELSFQVSCSYGPGRYDESYEQGGQDYPLPYVRWTEQRNFEAVLGLMKSGALDVKALITHRFALDRALEAYEAIQNDPSALGVVLEYPTEGMRETVVKVKRQTPEGRSESRRRIAANGGSRPTSHEQACVGVIGAGGFAKAVLIPAIVKTNARLAWVANRTGMTATHVGRKFGAERATSDYRQVLEDLAVNAVFIAVGHDAHARMVCEALEAGKHVFVEKPLALNEEQLSQVSEAYQSAQGLELMVGFNRRFSPHVVQIKKMLAGRAEPLCMNTTVNAGFIPADHWTQNPERGGGRIIGEGCHFIDLLAFLAGSPVVSVSAVTVGQGAIKNDKMSIQLEFADGSIGTVNYFANGSKSYPKESLEVFSDGRVLRMDNFRLTTGYGFKGFRKLKTWRQDKGHAAEVAAFVARVEKGGQPLISFEQLVNVTRASFAAMESAQSGQRVWLTD